MPSQKGIFPKRSLSRNPKIDPIFLPPPNHTLWTLWSWAHLSCIGWVQMGGVLALVCAFHYLLHLSSYTFMPFCRSCHVSFCCVSLMFMPILYGMKGVGSWACTISSYFPVGLDIGLAKVPTYPVCWAFTLVTSLPTMPMSLLAIIHVMLAHWAYYLFSWVFPAHLLYFYFFAMPMGLLTVNLVILTHWAYYLFRWTSPAHLLYFYPLLCL